MDFSRSRTYKMHYHIVKNRFCWVSIHNDNISTTHTQTLAQVQSKWQGSIIFKYFYMQ